MLYLRKIIKLPGKLSPEDAYLESIPAIAKLDELEFDTPVTIFAGENGTGKSTLLEALALLYGFNPEGGSRNFNFSTADTHAGLHRLLRLHKGVQMPKDGFFLRAESFYNVASEVDRLYGPAMPEAYGGRSLHGRSHGEGFMALVLHRFRGKGLYILDEPESALSPTRQLSLLLRMRQLVADQSQFIIATHSPMLMAYPGARIVELSEYGLNTIPYKETAHYIITKRFLDDPESMLKTLMEDEL